MLKIIQELSSDLEFYESILEDLFDEKLNNDERLGIQLSQEFWKERVQHFSQGVGEFEVKKAIQEFQIFLERDIKIVLQAIGFQGNVKQVRSTMLYVLSDIKNRCDK